MYYLVSVRRFDKYGHYKNGEKKQVTDYEALPSEVKYFIVKYKIDTKKTNLRALLKLIGFILGLDIAFLSIFGVLIFKDNIVLLLVVSAILVIPLFLISLKFVGNYFKKKGFVKNE